MARTKAELAEILSNTKLRLNRQFGSQIDSSRLRQWMEESLKARTDLFLRKTLGPLDDEDFYNLHVVANTPVVVPEPKLPPVTRAKKGAK